MVSAQLYLAGVSFTSWIRLCGDALRRQELCRTTSGFLAKD